MVKRNLLKLFFVWNFHNKIVCWIYCNIFGNSEIRLCDKNKFFYLDCILQYFCKYHPYYLSIRPVIWVFKPVIYLLLISNWYFASYESLAYKWNWSVSCSWFLRLSNTFTFPDYKPPIISIRYGWSGISGWFGLYVFMSFFVT